MVIVDESLGVRPRDLRAVLVVQSDEAQLLAIDTARLIHLPEPSKRAIADVRTERHIRPGERSRLPDHDFRACRQGERQ